MSNTTNEWYEEMLRLGVDGIVFYPIMNNPYDKNCTIHCQYATEQFKDVKGYPKSNRCYYKIIENRMVYIDMNGNLIRDNNTDSKELTLNIKTESIRAELSCLNCVKDHDVYFKDSYEINGDIRHLKMGTQVLPNYKCEQCGCKSFNVTLFYSVSID